MFAGFNPLCSGSACPPDWYTFLVLVHGTCSADGKITVVVLSVCLSESLTGVVPWKGPCYPLWLHPYTHTHTRAHIYTLTHTCIHPRMHKHVHTLTSLHTHAHTHLYSYTHMHTHTLRLPGLVLIAFSCASLWGTVAAAERELDFLHSHLVDLVAWQ